MNKSAVIIFIKNPDLGRVKKRLAKSLGNDIALEIYKQMLEHTKQITKSLSGDKFLYYDRLADTTDDWSNDIYQKKIQHGKDMATRIQNAFKETFAKGYEHVVIIGSDCFDLDERIIRLAFRQLDHFDYVLGPTKGGGLYLLGVNKVHLKLFKIEGWGTPELALKTQKNIQHLNKSCFMLSELSDVVTIEDLSCEVKLLVG